ncbi:hypothetical protein, partial [Winogradskya humida]
RRVPAPPAARPVQQPEVIDAYFTTRRPERRRVVIAGALGVLLVVALAALLDLRGQKPGERPPAAMPIVNPVTATGPLEHGHAGNDYLNARPLQDALDHKFTSFEADVFLRAGNLVLCHQLRGDVCEDHRGIRITPKTFASTYLRGLNTRVSANGGRVYPGYNQPVLLFVEIKCVEAAGACTLPADPAAAAADPNNPLVVAKELMNALIPYRGMLYHVDVAAGRRWGPVQIVLTGSHNDDQLPAGADDDESVRDLLARQTDTYAFLDGRFDVDRDLYSADLVPVISFQDPADGGCASSVQQAHWDDIVKAQTTGHHVRTGHLLDCAGGDVWTDALYAGVDYLSSSQLPQLGGWLTDNAHGGGGGNCAVPSWIATKQLYGQYCTLASADVPVMSRPDPKSSRVGSLAKAGAHWFLGQQPGEPDARDSSTNFWWAYTQADNGEWGWVSLVHFAAAGPDQSADGLQYGCYDVRPGESDDCHPL